MSWIAIDKNGKTYIYEYKPEKSIPLESYTPIMSNWVIVPEGTAEKLTGRPMTWADEPRELE